MKILLNLLAGVALLVWGTHIVRTSILRLYGGDLRRILRQSVSNRFAAFAAGLGVTALIQSSNATASAMPAAMSSRTNHVTRCQKRFERITTGPRNRSFP